MSSSTKSRRKDGLRIDQVAHHQQSAGVAWTRWNGLVLALVLLSGFLLLFASPKGPVVGIVGLPSVSHDETHTEKAAHDPYRQLTQEDADRRSYSLFMHHTSGYAAFTIGVLMIIDRSTRCRYRFLQHAIGAVWMLFGLFIFVQADPDAWPIGRGFIESWAMPTAGEWLQHKLLSGVPFVLGLYAIHHPATGYTRRLTYAVGVVSVLGAGGLLYHQHLDHPGMDVVNTQHRLFAGTALLIAVSLFQEARGRRGWSWKNHVLPTLLIILALQLVWYVE
ncbi:MAG: hypothetical protein U0236_03030 [Nitrospira sp.]